MRKITFLVYFLTFSLILGNVSISGGKDGRKSDKKRVINIENLNRVHGTTPVPFLGTLAESFEGVTFPPAGWVNLSIPGNDAYARITVGTSPLPGWNGGTATTPTGGGTAAAYVTWGQVASSNDEWLITPQIMNVQANDSLYFWLIKPGYTNAYLDNMDIKISTTTNNTSSFTITVAALVFPANTSDTTWTRRGYNIGSLVPPGSNIYIAFREHVFDNFTDGAAFLVDLVQVTGNPVGVTNNNSEVPKSYNLNQNYPNPFNPSTNFNFGLPKSGNVKLAVYDILGNEVAVVVNGFKQAGNYSVNFDASNLSSGVYFYRLISGDFSKTMKMSLIK